MQILTTLILYITFVNDPKWKTKQRQGKRAITQRRLKHRKNGYGCLEARAGPAGHCSSPSYRLEYLTIIPRAQMGS